MRADKTAEQAPSGLVGASEVYRDQRIRNRYDR